jgi:4-amino-4-deoxy-L-arabinose transferase-like glycosyltransferase
MRIKLLVLITLLGAALRFSQLGNIPSSLNWDEIAIGYNAYSILKTGHDEYGTLLPLTFRSFEDYKSPLYIYLTVPSILIFGKTEFAIRFTSALLGSLTVPLLYAVTTTLLKPKTKENNPLWQNRIKNVGVISSFILAITPWHVHFSRVAFEANIGLFFISLGTLLLGKWLTNPKLFVLITSAISYSLAIHSYANMRLLVPLLLIPLLFIHKQAFLNYKKHALIALLTAILLISPIILQLIQGQGLARFQATALIFREDIYQTQKLRSSQEISSNNKLIAQTLFNYRVPLLTEITNSYLSHFRFDFLFGQNTNSRANVPGLGLLYLWYLPFATIGVIGLAKFSKEITSTPTFLWLLLTPVPSALTWDTPHAIRSQATTIPIVIITALGIWIFLKWLQSIELQNYKKYHLMTWIIPKVGLVVFTTTALLSVLTLIFNYNTHLNSEYAQTWLWGRKEMVSKVNELKPQFNQVKVSLSIEWGYLWFLWYADIDPHQWLQSGGTKGGGFDFPKNELDNIKFENFDYTKESQDNTGILFVGTPKDFPPEFVPTYIIENTQRQKFIYIVRS